MKINFQHYPLIKFSRVIALHLVPFFFRRQGVKLSSAHYKRKKSLFAFIMRNPQFSIIDLVQKSNKGTLMTFKKNLTSNNISKLNIQSHF